MRKDKELKFILNEAKKVKGKIILLTILNIVYAFLAVVFALCCKEIIDGASEKNKNKIILTACIFLLIIIIQFTLKIIISYFYEKTKSLLLKENRQNLLADFLNKEYEEINKIHSGEILNKIFQDVEILSEGISNLLPNAMNMITRLITALVVLFVLDYRFALIFTFVGLILFLIAYLYRKKIKKVNKEVLKQEDIMRSFYQEAVTNNLIIKIYNNQKEIIKKGENIQNDYLNLRIKRRMVAIQANSGLGLVFNGFYFFALIWGAINIYQNDFSLGYGTLFALLELVNQISGPIASLSSIIPQYYGLIASVERILFLYELKEEKHQEFEINDFDEIEGKNLSFSYKDNIILDNVNFNVKKNDFIAITGLSGGGKTTLFNLLLGVYKSFSGTLKLKYLNDEYSLGDQTRKLFSYVPQGNSMFSGTIRENVTFLNKNIDEETINKYLILSCCDFVFSLKDGINTRIGEKGIGLSEGQNQRLAIARSLINDTPILLFDESTSALDEETEAKVLKNISSLNKTVLIVTHRKKAIEYCNKVIIIDNKKIKVEEK